LDAVACIGDRSDHLLGIATMSLESEGYLSPDVGSWIAKHRSQNRSFSALPTG
jgi:hypothetical protein